MPFIKMPMPFKMPKKIRALSLLKKKQEAASLFDVFEELLFLAKLQHPKDREVIKDELYSIVQKIVANQHHTPLSQNINHKPIYEYCRNE